MGEYPHELQVSYCLSNGSEIVIRPIRPGDAALEQEFTRSLSDDSRYYRFMGQLRELGPRKLRYFTRIDYHDHMALIATARVDGCEKQIGVARYIVAPGSESCEFAIVVADAWQGSGVAHILMEQLFAAARRRGVKVMVGNVLAANQRMLKFCRRLGFEFYHEPQQGDTVSVVRTL